MMNGNQGDDHDEVEMPICENTSMLNQYGVIYYEMQVLPRDDLVKTTGCLMPCYFVEYTVSLFSYFQSTDLNVEWFECICCISELSESIASRKGKCFVCSIGSCPGPNSNCADRAGGLPFSVIRGRCWRNSWTVHWFQLFNGLGLDCEGCSLFSQIQKCFAEIECVVFVCVSVRKCVHEPGTVVTDVVFFKGNVKIFRTTTI